MKMFLILFYNSTERVKGMWGRGGGDPPALSRQGIKNMFRLE